VSALRDGRGANEKEPNVAEDTVSEVQAGVPNAVGRDIGGQGIAGRTHDRRTI